MSETKQTQDNTSVARDPFTAVGLVLLVVSIVLEIAKRHHAVSVSETVVFAIQIAAAVLIVVGLVYDTVKNLRPFIKRHE